MAARWGAVHGGSATQKEGRTTWWRRWRRSSGAYLSLQSASYAVEKEKKGGGFNGAGDSRFGENRGRARMERKVGKRRGIWGVPAHGGAGGGEGEARAALAGPIYMLVMSVPAARYFSPAELT